VDVLISAAKVDQGTEHVADAVAPTLDALGRQLSGSYGGLMDHLWIDLELCPDDADRRPPWSFRFQKVVRPSRLLAGLPARTYENVGHYSVRPDYHALARVPLPAAAGYLARLIFDSTETLRRRQKTLGSFDVEAFRARFSEILSGMGLGHDPAS
jgi:hypothetical protein